MSDEAYRCAKFHGGEVFARFFARTIETFAGSAPVFLALAAWRAGREQGLVDAGRMAPGCACQDPAETKAGPP